MRGASSDTDYYVAPPEVPASRRPPIINVGPVAWLRQNLFSSPINSVVTVIAGGLIAWFLWLFISWAVTQAQWGVVFNNLRLIGSGLYDPQEIWRVELSAAFLVFLTALSLGIWGYVSRGAFLTVLVVMLVVLIVPLIGARLPKPPVHILVEPQATPYAFIFTGVKNQEITFGIDPLTEVEDAGRLFPGYVESNSRTEWSTQSREARVGNLDLGQYNLSLTVQLLDHLGDQITAGGSPVQVISKAEQNTIKRTVTLPRDGWYVLQVERDDTAKEENVGYAWLKVEGVDLFGSRDSAIQEVGPPPTVERAFFAEERAYRFEGSRSFREFVALQLAPFFNAFALELIVGFALFFNGWLIGLLGKRERAVRRTAVVSWILSSVLILFVLRGFQGSRLLPEVPTSAWGGLLLTMLLTIVGITASFPLGVALALGRRSSLPVIKWICTLFIEVVRGVPLITILFMAKLIVPFFWSALTDIDLSVRMMIGVTLFTAAYQAENVRGGLQIIPHGQIEAARALGMNPLLTTTFIVLPQALRAVIPAIVGQFISLFKDTSLVAVVGLFELVGIVDTIVSGQPIYRPYQREAYIFIAIIYFVISYAMSDVSHRLEASGAGSVRK